MNLNDICSSNGKYGSIFFEVVSRFASDYSFVKNILDTDYNKVYDYSIGKDKYTSNFTSNVLSTYKYDADTIFYKKSSEDLKNLKDADNNYIPVKEDVTDGVTQLEFPCVKLKNTTEEYLASLSRKNRYDIQRKLKAFKGTISNEFTEDCVRYYLDNIKEPFKEHDALHILYCYSRYLLNKDDVISCTLVNEEGKIDTFSAFVKEEFGWHAVCNHGHNGTASLFYAMNALRDRYGDIQIFIDISYNLKAGFSVYFRCLCNTALTVPCVFYSTDTINVNAPDVYYSASSHSIKKFSDFIKFKKRTIDECIEYNKDNLAYRYSLEFFKSYNVKADLFLLEDKSSKFDGIVYDFCSENIINIPYTFDVSGKVEDLARAMRDTGYSIIRHLKCYDDDVNKLIKVEIPSITLNSSMESFISTLKSSRRNKIKRCLKSIDNYDFNFIEGLDKEVLDYYISTIDKHKNPAFEYAVMSCAYASDILNHNVYSVSIKDKDGKLLGGDVLLIDYNRKIVYCWAGHTDSSYNDLGSILMYKDLEYIHNIGKFDGWLFEPTFLETLPWENPEFKCDFSDFYKLHFSNGVQDSYILNISLDSQDYYTKPYYSCDQGWHLN